MWYEGIHVGQDGRPRRIRFRLLAARPMGTDVGLEIDFGDDPVRITGSSLSELVDIYTGEIIEDVRSYFLARFFDGVAGTDGIPLWAVIDAIPVTGIGPTRSAALARHFRSWRRMRETLAASDPWGDAYWLAAEALGPATCDALIEFFADSAAVAAFDRCLAGRPIADHVDVEGPFTGEVVCFTGTLDGMSRAEAQEAARRAGAAICTSVSRRTTLVVSGHGSGSKVAKARNAGIPIIDEAAFLSRLSEK